VTAAVAFFRNLNLGQRRSHSPTRPELLAAFERAGAPGAVNFQVNGTVVFETDADPQVLADETVRQLTPVCGYDDLAIARPVDWVHALDLDPAHVPDHAEVSFFDGPDPFPEPLPWEAPRGGLTVVRADTLHAVSVNDVEGTSGATYVLEKRLGVPVTSRGVPTIRRLQVRLASLGS
jgi:uncharacterized protein DUF1697